MDLYELFLLGHIVSAVIWLGAGFVLTMLITKAEREDDVETQGRLFADIDWLAPRLFIPASFLVLVFGLLCVAEGPWSFEQLWVSLGFAGWAVSFGIGIGYFKPEGERIAGLIDAEGPESSEARWRTKRMHAIDRMELTVLYLVVAVMIVKPTGDDTGFLIAAAAILAAVIALEWRGVRTAPAGASPG